MRITESRLRRIIRSVIKESYISNRTPEQEEADILDRFPDHPYSMPELGVKDVKFLLGLEHNESKALTYIPKFLRRIFPQEDIDERSGIGRLVIDRNKLRDLGFDEEEIEKLTGTPEGRADGLVGQVFRPMHYRIIF